MTAPRATTRRRNRAPAAPPGAGASIRVTTRAGTIALDPRDRESRYRSAVHLGAAVTTKRKDV